jgi:hypothetical protein
LGDWSDRSDCPLARFLKRTFNLEKSEVNVGYSYMKMKGQTYNLKNYVSFYISEDRFANRQSKVEILGLELPLKYWCIPTTPELSEMFNKILSRKRYDSYGKDKNDIFFMKTTMGMVGYYSVHPSDGTKNYPIVSVDFVLEQLEALPEEKVIKIDDLQFGDIAEITYDAYDNKYVGEIVMCINDHDTKTVVSIQSKNPKKALYIPWVLPKNLQFKVLKSTTLTR